MAHLLPKEYLLGDFSPILLKSENDPPIDITNLVSEIQVEENIFSPYVKGCLIFKDAASYRIIRRLELKGGPETSISFSFRGVQDDGKGLQEEIELNSSDYFLYKFTPAFPTNKTSQQFVLNFIHRCFFEDQQFKLSKCFKKEKINTIVESLGSEIELEWDEVEETKGDIVTALPYDNIFKHISSLLKYSVRTENIDDVNYVFWQNIKGKHNFVSLGKLYSEESSFGSTTEITDNNFEQAGFIYAEYLSGNNYAINRRLTYVHHSKNKSLYEESLAGTYTSGINFVDPHYMNSHEYLTYDINEEWDKQTHITSERIIDKNSLFWEQIKGPFFSSEYNVKQHGYCCKESPGGQRNEPYCASKRLSLMGQMFQLGIEFVVSGFSDTDKVSVGKTILFSRPLMYDPEFQIKQDDIFYKGKFLVTSMKHVVNLSNALSPKYFCRIRAHKDSLGD